MTAVESDEALDSTLLRTPVAAVEMEEASEEASEATDDASEATEEAPEPTADATEVKTVETSLVKVDPSETMVEAIVEMAERPPLPPLTAAVEKIVVLPMVVSPVLDPLTMVETTGAVVIAETTPV